MYMQKEYPAVADLNESRSVFYADVMRGLCKPTKSLSSKYFYDAKGDVLFQQIMRSPAYYLTRCEEEIFKQHTRSLVEALFSHNRHVDLIELGAGDASKTHHLIARLIDDGYQFTYRPIDISPHIIEELEQDMKAKFPKLTTEAFQGDYFEGLAAIHKADSSPKVVLFLGANIGNMTRQEAEAFCHKLRAFMNSGDRLLVGFDLMKNPRIVQAAYDDEEGLTWQFNINLLHRMNTELGADFNPDLFEHYCQYDPLSGTCSSYLVSLLDHVVHFPEEEVTFTKGELIHMEVSQKYQFSETETLAKSTGFMPIDAMTDSKEWFVDVIWEAR